MMKLVEEARPRCPDCGSRDAHGAGWRFRVTTQDMVRAYKCRRCAASFTAGTMRNMKRPKVDVDRAVELAKDGLTYAEIARTLYREQGGKPISRDTVKRWVERFAPAHKFTYEEFEADPAYVAAVRRGPRHKVPAVHLADLRETRRVILGPEMRSIAKHPVVDFGTDVYRALHGPKKGPNVHPGSLSVKQCRRLARMLGWSMEKLEKHVVKVFSGKSGQSREQTTSFPIAANPGWAFLMGLFYSSGGVGEQEVHFAVDKPVGLYLQQELAKDIGTTPSFRSTACRTIHAPKGTVHYDKPHEHGSYKLIYPKVVLEELETFGLKTAPPFRLGKGKFVPSRGITCGVPNWVRRDPAMLHRFVEGYINGIRTSCELKGFTDDVDRTETEGKKRRKGHATTATRVSVNFYSLKEKEVRSFMSPFVRHFRKMGMKIWVLKARRDGRRMKHWQVSFHTVPAVRAFHESFLMLRPMIRTKLQLRFNHDDPVLRRVTQRIRGADGFIVGLLVEGPKTTAEIADVCPHRPYNMTTEEWLKPSFDRLSRMGVIRRRGRRWVYDPRRFARNLAAGFLNEWRHREAKYRALKHKDVYLCAACGTVGEEVTCGLCGRPRVPAGDYALRRLRNPRAKAMADELLAAVRS